MAENKEKEPLENELQEDEEEIILLEDLAPIKDVKGGSGTILFGEEVVDDERRGENETAESKDEKSGP